ncbi:unnamed protein product [Arabidopsis arenosa]|uniref:RING-type E3 ubiquitin transferase n=1 Tax=Arabidopsis arenosa TaxID=38785 RepID=A0A8S2AVX6_ARAAE|nr:unnamed protein product [Arabidopsis arenosa]
MGWASSVVNGLSNIHLQRKRTEDETRSAMLDLDFLDCPICVEPFTIPIFQCDNGHLACASCCPKLSNKCPACTLPVGHNRCRAMESILESISVPCENAKFGCTKKVSYGKQSTHEKECTFSPCFCPIQNCNYSGLYKDVYYHFAIHRDIGRVDCWFVLGEFVELDFDFKERAIMGMNAYKEDLLFTVQCLSDPNGITYVTVSCIAPSLPEVGAFSCHISTTFHERAIVYNSMKVKNIRKLSFQIPQEDFMLVPSYFLCGRQSFKLKICVNKLSQEPN